MDIKVILGENQKVEAHYKDFVIITDQPVQAGGDNEYPSPFDLFLASLATCAGFYVKQFCLQRDLPQEGIKITQKMQRDSQTRMISRIDIEIKLPKSFPEKYHQSVVKAAEACTVKKQIAQAPEFNIFTKVE
jgi:putative redox protein